MKQAEIIREKGTNRSAFFRGEVNKYGWVSIGSSFLPSDIIASILWSQLEQLEEIQNTRKILWDRYWNNLSEFLDPSFAIPFLPEYATNNGHMFFIILNEEEQRPLVINSLKQKGIHSAFHYLSLHKSPFYHKFYEGKALTESDRYTNCLLRLPFYYGLRGEQVDIVCKELRQSCATLSVALR
jgi:dTDP-4-amino-4,6-dideoxygalactose transaminase